MPDIVARLRNEAAFTCDRCPAPAVVALVVVEGAADHLLCDDCARAIGLALMASQPGRELPRPVAAPVAPGGRSGVCPTCGQVVGLVALGPNGHLWWQVDDHQRPVMDARMQAREWAPCAGVGLLVPAHATSAR